MELQILQHRAELFNPTAHVVLAAFSHHSKLGGTCHTLTADMYLFPTSVIAEQLNMERLVAIFLWRINVVDDTTRFLVEDIGQPGVDM